MNRKKTKCKVHTFSEKKLIKQINDEQQKKVEMKKIKTKREKNFG